MEWKHPRAPRASSDANNMLTVEVIENHIYFYADVDADRSLALIQELRRLDAKLRNEHASRGLDAIHPATPIWLHIYSYGGDLFAGFSIADQIGLIKTPVYTIVEGVCASAATLIAMSGSHRYILPSAFMLVHQLSSGVWGTHEQFKDEVAMQEKAMSKLVAFYEQRCKLSAEKIREMLARDTWMDAEQCVEAGFVTEVKIL